KSRFYDIDTRPHVDDRSVIVSTYDGSTYSRNRSNGSVQRGFAVGSYSGFLVEQERGYFSGLKGKFYVLDPKCGQPVWSTPYKGRVGARPVRAEDSLVIPVSGDPLYVLDAKNGKVQTSLNLGAASLSQVAAAQGSDFYCLSNYG